MVCFVFALNSFQGQRHQRSNFCCNAEDTLSPTLSPMSCIERVVIMAATGFNSARCAAI
jgi:hypothetical protein